MPATTLTLRALNRALLARQMLLAREAIPPARAIERLAGMQAQQAQPPFIGLWTRIAGFQREQLLRPIADRKVVRATLMRATLHLMAAKDYISLRHSLQPALTAAMNSVLRGRAAALDAEAILAAAKSCFEQPRTFTELRAALMASFPGADERAMGYLVRTHLPLVAVPDDSAWGFRADSPFRDAGREIGRPVNPEGNLAGLVSRYLAAFGPAAPRDMQSWSGLARLKESFDALRPKLVTLRDERGRELFDVPGAPRPPEDTPAPVRFLPAFDNVVLSHVDRSRIIADEYRPRVVTRNLLVLPTFLVDGFVAGTWKSERTGKSATLTISPFAKLSKAAKSELSEEAESLVRFAEPGAGEYAIRWSPV